MENKDFNSVSYDYFSNTSSYVKTILDMLPESKVSMEKKIIIKELYNYFLNQFDEEKIKEIATISSMFREKIALSSLEATARHAEYMYVNFLDKIIFDSINRERIFDIMNESMKVYVEYFTKYQEKSVNRQNNIVKIGYAR